MKFITSVVMASATIASVAALAVPSYGSILTSQSTTAKRG